MSSLSIWVQGDTIMLNVENDEGATTIRMSDEKAKELLLNLAKFLLSKGGSTSLLASSANPQVSTDDDGTLVLSLALEPLPLVEVRMTDSEASDLAEVLQDFLSMPMDIRRAGTH